jgi:predicted transposase YdaD
MVYIQEVEQAYQQWVKERRAEGKIEGEAALVVKLLSRKIGVLSPAMLVQINSLSLEQVEALGEALLDFTKIEDLVAWLEVQK